MKTFDLAVLGELLVDFTDSGESAAGQRLFEQNAGGAVANVACCVAHLGMKSAFIGKVGNDMHGRFLKQTLESKGVNTEGLIVSSDVFTTLAFVSLSEGERSFSFARKPGADTCLTASELNMDILSNCRILDIGSLSLTDEPARSATWEALKIAKSAGAMIAYDPNFRAPLWSGTEFAVQQMRSVLPAVDYIKISDEETELITGCKDPNQALQYLIKSGANVACVTLGADGALIGNKDKSMFVPAFKVKSVDTTGAGDAFWGAFLYCLLKNAAPSAADLQQFGRFACAAAAICVGRRGAIPAMPSKAEIEQLLC